MVIINSNVKRGLVDSEYNARRKQCETGARFFGVEKLRDVALEQFEAVAHELDSTIAKRVRYVLSENARTLAAADALAEGGSRASMRDDFEITVPAIDTLVTII